MCMCNGIPNTKRDTYRTDFTKIIIDNVFILQIATFLRKNISYDGHDTYGIVLNKVPNLDAATKKQIRDYVRVKTTPTRGAVSNPRPFLTNDLAEQQEVHNNSIYHLKIQIYFVFCLAFITISIFLMSLEI